MKKYDKIRFKGTMITSPRSSLDCRHNLGVNKGYNLTQPNENGRLFPVPSGTVAIGGGCASLRSETTPRSQPAVPSPPATCKSNYIWKTLNESKS